MPLPPDMEAILPALASLHVLPADCVDLVRHVTDVPHTREPVVALKNRLLDSGLALPGDLFERFSLLLAATHSLSQLDSLPVHLQVKQLLRREYDYFANPRGRPPFVVQSYPFAAACRLATCRRFPAGPMDWEHSGLPRSWFLGFDRRTLPRLLWFLARHGWFRPCFFMHVGLKPRNRGLLLEKEVARSYYRIASSLALQPRFHGLLAASWFHDPGAVLENPHLEWLNRPYRDHGGFITTMGPATPDTGMAGPDPDRVYRVGVAFWPRDAAIQWAHRNAHLEN